MSSIGKQTTETGVRYFIQLSPGENKQRPRIHLGAVSRKQAESAKIYIEDLLKSKVGDGLKTATQEWLAGIPVPLRERLEKLQLVETRGGKRWTVASWVSNYIKNRPDVKETTKRKWQDVESRLAAFFRGDCIGDVTVQHAKNFRIYLQSTVGLSENTLRRHIGISRQFFNAAVDAELINKNPFRGQSVSIRANDSRFYYVSLEAANKVLEACPNAEWRLIFGLARFGGLRCPSEVLRLKWIDVDFEKQRFTVHASKTEHHADKGIRVVPMFPELKPLFQDAFDLAKDGAVYCIEQHREAGMNLRTHLTRIIQRAGLKSWPKLFQNLRSTRETELFKMTGGNVKAVCQWIGNTPAVAMTHYAQVTEADIKEAAKMTIINDAEKRLNEEVHNQVHTSAESSGTAAHETPEHIDVSPEDCGDNLQLAGGCGSLQNSEKWAILDLNLNSKIKPQTTPVKELTAKSAEPPKGQGVHNQAHILTNYPELATVIAAWPGLSEDTRQTINSLVNKETKL